jgi:uncharacterized membrane protein
MWKGWENKNKKIIMTTKASTAASKFSAHYNERLHDIVNRSIEEESILMHQIQTDDKKLTFGQRIADKVASFGGSWKFIITFGVFLALWIAFNSIAISSMRFDPFPFILMNLVLSCIAALQAPVIMMSQNRQEEKDRCRNENDYMVNLKSELQIRSLHEKIDLLELEEIRTIFETQKKQLELLQSIEKKLNNLKSPS